MNDGCDRSECGDHQCVATLLTHTLTCGAFATVRCRVPVCPPAAGQNMLRTSGALPQLCVLATTSDHPVVKTHATAALINVSANSACPVRPASNPTVPVSVPGMNAELPGSNACARARCLAGQNQEALLAWRGGALVPSLASAIAAASSGSSGSSGSDVTPHVQLLRNLTASGEEAVWHMCIAA